jgi:hypothetical protein
VNCEQTFMARKLNVTKLPRQNSAEVQTLNRRPPPSASTLYLMQLRAQSLKISSQPRRTRLDIDAEPGAETPQPVEIVRVEEDSKK